jgi:3-oxoacid CoA-transferase B subunit
MVTSTRVRGLTRDLIAMRAARELPDGSYVNLGIGIPTLVSNWIEGRDISLHAEIGMLETGPLAEGGQIDPDLINASCQPVTALPGASFFDMRDSFAMITGGHIDVAIMGALQVAENGDFAGWLNPDRGLSKVGNIGGSMDLAVGARRVIIAMEHTATTGAPKIVERCSYPLTAHRVVSLIITDLAVIEVTPAGLLLKEIYPGLTPGEVQAVTAAPLRIAPGLREIEL